MKATRAAVLAASVWLSAGMGPVAAQETYKIGAALGLTGYAAASDRAWRDGQILAVEALNAREASSARRSSTSARTTGRSRRRRWSSTGR